MTALPVGTEAILKKVRRRIVPLLFLGYMFAILDRGAISFAALKMNADLGLSATAFGIATAAFFVGYLVFEIPSNMLLQRFGARVWIARVMLSWGIVTALLAATRGATDFAILRFLLGAAEAGFLPGVIYYLTLWFPKSHRSRTIADFTMSIPIVSAIGAVAASTMLQIQGFGLKGWQWLFMLEAAPTILLSVVIFLWLPSTYRDAKFLTSEEKATLGQALARAGPGTAEKPVGGLFWCLLANPVLWLLGLTNLGFILASYTIGTWMPQLITGYDFSIGQTGFIVALPQVAGAVAILAWGRADAAVTSGKFGLVAPLAAAATCMLLSTLAIAVHQTWLVIVTLTLSSAALYTAIPAFWARASSIIDPGQAAPGIAMVNTIGSLSGVIGPPTVGFIHDKTNSFSGGFAVATCFLVSSIAFAAALNRRTFATGRKEGTPC